MSNPVQVRITSLLVTCKRARLSTADNQLSCHRSHFPAGLVCTMGGECSDISVLHPGRAQPSCHFAQLLSKPT